MSAIHPLPLILASDSKSRQRLLAQTGLAFTSKSSGFDESTVTATTPTAKAIALARAKASAVKVRLDKPALILAADTLILFNDQIIEKPKYKMDAVTIIQQLAGETHTVITGWAIFNTYKNTWYEGVTQTKVTFRQLLHHEIVEYANDNPVTQWAGGYNVALSSAIGFITKVEGSYTGLNGLPVDQIIPHLVHEWAHPYKPRSGSKT